MKRQNHKPYNRYSNKQRREYKMWVVIHKEKMSIFSGYKTMDLAERACDNLNSVKKNKYYVEFVEVRG